MWFADELQLGQDLDGASAPEMISVNSAGPFSSVRSSPKRPKLASHSARAHARAATRGTSRDAHGCAGYSAELVEDRQFMPLSAVGSRGAHTKPQALPIVFAARSYSSWIFLTSSLVAFPRLRAALTCFSFSLSCSHSLNGGSSSIAICGSIL